MGGIVGSSTAMTGGAGGTAPILLGVCQMGTAAFWRVVGGKIVNLN